MTTLKTAAKHVSDCIDRGEYDGEVIIKEDRQAIATLLFELLEGIEAPECIDDSCEHIHEGYFQAIEKAQAIIRQTLEGKQE